MFASEFGGWEGADVSEVNFTIEEKLFRTLFLEIRKQALPYYFATNKKTV